MTGISSIGLRANNLWIRILLLAAVAAALHSICMAELKPMSEQEFEKLLRKAENGSLSAQAEVATAYAVGRTGSINYEEAARWYKKAANQGNPESQTNLAVFYLTGRGVERSDSEAFRWLQRAASSSYPLALHDLGILYSNGWGVAKDPAHGFELLLRAATAGLEMSQVDVGLAYLNGNAVPADPEMGIKWLKRAAKHDLALAHFILGIAYENGQGVDIDYKKAAEHYLKAADQGVAAAQNNLGRLYLRGNGVGGIDRRQAFRLFSQSAEQGNGQGYLNLALCHLTGCTGVIDVTEAYSWYLRAQQSGIPIPEPFEKRFSAIGQELTHDQLQAAQTTSSQWIAQHPAVDPRSPLQAHYVPTPTLMARGQQTLQNDEVLKTLWQRTQYTPPPRSNARDSVR